MYEYGYSEMFRFYIYNDTSYQYKSIMRGLSYDHFFYDIDGSTMFKYH